MPPLDPIPEFDLYAELKVAPDADAAAIERAWRAGVRSVHPDRAITGDERAATTRTARLNIAREWLDGSNEAGTVRPASTTRPERRASRPSTRWRSWPVRVRDRASPPAG